MKLAVALVTAAAAALFAWGWRLIHTPLEPLVAAALARAVGVDAAEVSVGRVRPAWLGAELDDVRIGPAHAARLRVGIDRRRVLISGLRLGKLGAAELALELVDGRPHRAAFSGGSLGPLDGLAGSALRDGDRLSLRAARPGLLIAAEISRELRAKVTLERLPLGGFSLRGIDLASATLSGQLEVRRAGGEWQASGSLAADELTLDHPTVAARRLEHLAPKVQGTISFLDGSFSSDGLELSLGALTVGLKGSASTVGVDLTADLQPVACARALVTLRPFLPALDGLVADGQLAGHAEISAEWARLDDLELDLEPEVGCRVERDAPLGDLAALAGHAPYPPQNRAWKSLASLRPEVVRPFVAAEDGRFFRHHGFDAEMIRRALAHDLDKARVEKGASTITQQLVKNLFLSGERSLTRKLEEAVLAWRAEQVLDKRRILELYLNVVELAPGTHGIGEGAERYFGKEPEEISADEAAQLAALLPAPRRGMDDAWQRRYQTLKARLPSEKVPVQLTRR